VRNSIALASLFLSILVNTTLAQCPNTISSCSRTAPVRSCCQSSVKPAPVIYPAQASRCQIASSAQGCPAPLMQGETAVQSYRLVQSCPGMQIYPPSSHMDNTYALQSSPSRQIETIVLQPSPTHTLVSPQSAPHVAQGNCNCNRGTEMQTFSPHATPQTASILEHKRNPFSLAGHSRERRPPDFCAQEFFACCDSGGKDCVAAYLNCAEITGEQVRHYACPSDGVIDKQR
jgi:hypothetical protein